MKKVLVFAATAAALQAAHHVGDYWVQTSHQANEKGSPGPAGLRACAGHVTTYTAVCTAAVLAVKALGAPISTRGIIAGQAINAVSHFVMDRRPWGRAIMNAAGRGELAAVGTPREQTVLATPPITGESVPIDIPHLGTGANALDQSWHIGWLAISAYVTAVLS